MRVYSWFRGRLAAGFALLGVLQCGCSGSAKAAKGPEIVERNNELTHDDCDVDSGSAERLDANGDGKADVISVRDGQREVCRAVDLNFDGRIDSWIYFGPDGSVRRRENDYDRDGKIDEIAVYRSGALAEKQRATMLANRIDTWEFYQGGKLARTERDSNGDKIVDQWWEYPTPGCPVIHADVNNDGRPDPGASVDYCKETGYVPPERQDYKKTESPTFEQKGTLPTEVETKDQPSPAPPAGSTPSAPAKGATGNGGGK